MPPRKSPETRPPSNEPLGADPPVSDEPLDVETLRVEPLDAETLGVEPLDAETLGVERVAAILDEIALLLDLTGENPFRSRAYVNAARELRSLEEPLETLVNEGRLADKRGFGAGMVEKVTELVRTGRLAAYDELRAKVPSELLMMLRVPGLGPKRIKEIHARLGICSVGDLEAAAKEGRIAPLVGFGEKTQAKILAGIEFLRSRGQRFLVSTARLEAERLVALLREHPAVQRVELGGSLRRKRETVGDLDIVLSSTDPRAVLDAFVGFREIDEVLSHGPTRVSARLPSGLQVDVRAVTDEQFPMALHYFTGSKEHNIAVRARAQKRGLKLNEYGLFRGEDPVPCADEAELFAKLDLAYIEPELREAMGEIEAAERGELPALVEEKDLQGVFHCHSVFSDGKNTMREMALAARELGYSYIGMSDHSQSAAYAGGMRLEDVKRYCEEIDRLNAELEGIRILKGTECDILADGALDYPDEILAGFDFVIGSIHSRFQMDAQEMTRRILRALANPYLDILGHLTGRRLLSRDSYAVDVGAVLDAAAAQGVVVEINAHPQRLELDWRECPAFKKRRGKVSINPDAHSTDAIRDARYGVGIARKGWLNRDDVVNTLPVDAVLDGFRQRRRARTRARAG